MRVVLHHPRLLPPRDYGGTERVVLWLARGLVERGHEVSVAAAAGSRLPVGVRLIELSEEEDARGELVRKLPPGTDLVHFQAPTRAGAALPCPSVLTVHGNGKPGERYGLNTVFLSADHARRHGARAFVHNGIDPAELAFERKKGTAYLFLSKTSWSVKNLRGAIRYSRGAGARLMIAGGSRPISARLRCLVTPGLEWLGPVSGARKARCLAEARALVFPVLWDEPFGLAVVEALMSGSPVLASRRGSLPELLDDSVGRTFTTDAEWLDALARGPEGIWGKDAASGELAERCRARAMRLFHYSQMAQGYESVYKRVAGGELLNDAEPSAAPA